MDKRKSEATIQWERRKLQMNKAKDAITKLSVARLENLASSGGALDVCSACHILDASPNSPLLAALNNWCDSSSKTAALKSKFQSMWVRMQPPSNLDTVPLPNWAAPLTWGDDQSKRSILGKTKVNAADFVPLMVDGVICTGKGSEKRALRLTVPELFGKKDEQEGEDGDNATMNTKVKAEVRIGDVIYSIEEKAKQGGKPGGNQKVSQREVVSYAVTAIDYNSGGVIGLLRKAKKAKAGKDGAGQQPKIFPLSLLSLYNKVIVRPEVVSGLEKVTAFVVRSPSVAAAYKVLEGYAEEDHWKQELNASTEIILGEQRKVAKIEGEKHYKDEKEAIKVVTELLRVIPVSYVKNDKASWLKIGRAMRAVSKDLMDDWATWSAGGTEMVYGRRNCVVEWGRFRPRTSFDNSALLAAREKEKVAKEELERLENDEDAGDFDIFNAKTAVERAGIDGVPKAEFQRVLFLDLTKKGGAREGEEGELEVPSLKCTYSSPTELAAMENVNPGGLVAAEARKGDFILLAGLNKNNTRGMGSGTGVDSMVLLQSRAEKQFLGKAVHKTVMKGKKENEKMKWSKVLEFSPIRHMVCVSCVPTATDPRVKKWVSIGVLGNAWVFRQEEGRKDGTLWRLPGGDMYWGLEVLKQAVEDSYRVGRRRGEGEGDDGSAEEIDLENIDMKKDIGLSNIEDGGGGRVGKGKVLKAALRLGLVKSAPNSLTICWVPSGCHVALSIANKAGSEWHNCYSGKQGGCVVSKLKDGTGYRVKVECEGRRSAFGTYSTTPLAPTKPVGLEWLGGNNKNRALKVKVRRGGVTGVVRVEHCQYNSIVGGKAGEWVMNAETKDDTYVIKGLKVGGGVRVRTRFTLKDGTVGVHSDILDLGAAPRRPGIIVLEFDEEGGAVGKDKGTGGDGRVETKVAKIVNETMASSHPIFDFGDFIGELQMLLPEGAGLGPAAEGRMEGGEDLPQGWEVSYSEKFQRKFYFHKETKRSCWTKPGLGGGEEEEEEGQSN